MRTFLLLAILLGSISVKAQKEKTVIPFVTLQQWTQSGYSTFHTQAKAIGFEFAGKESIDECTGCMRYSYKREISKNGLVYIESLGYSNFGTGKKAKVEYATTMFDLGTIYTGSIKNAGYAEADCVTNRDTEDDAKTVFCFKKKIHNIRLIETRKAVDIGGEATQYTILFYSLD